MTWEGVFDEFVKKMEALDVEADPEIAHWEADDLLLKFLGHCGYQRLVEAYLKQREKGWR